MELWGVIAPLRELKANTFMYIVGATIGVMGSYRSAQGVKGQYLYVYRRSDYWLLTPSNYLQ